ncbi:MAG TPA: HRDC domain-containing protein [Kofleriaceae bacterium]|nr:HRDC domain-containing protein [Kofleriaceae bacterium]
MTALVAEAAQVAAIADALAAAPLVAFDLEFLAQDRLVPTLCLVQVAWLPNQQHLDAVAGAIVSPEWAKIVSATPPEVALVDPLAVDVGPIVRALAAHRRAVVHAGRQDLQLLATRFGIAMPQILDTQVMAAFAGIGDQVGFATLANELLGTSLGKELQWTDWARRPLSDAQLAYADSDVRHLPAIFARLAAQLGPRLAWAQAESAIVAADAYAAAQITPETAWRQLGGLRGLDVSQLSSVVALAAWRQRVAIELDRPLGQVLNDKVLVDIARQRPTEEDALRSMKGIAPVARKRASEIIAALDDAPPVDLPVRPPSRPPSPRAQRWAELLLSIVQLVSEQTGVAARLLGTRADAEEVARALDERGLDALRLLPAFTTWRRDVLGNAWYGWLTGTLALVGDPTAPTGLALVPR